MMMNPSAVNQKKARLRAAAIHFSLSGVVAIIAALLVFGVWYPYPYREISGGRELFLLLVSVDVILGPLITLTIFDLRKPPRELRRDMSLIVVLQIAALVYGLNTMLVARPVHIVFEIDRFRVVHAIDVPSKLLSETPAGIEPLPYSGPSLLGLRQFKSEEEKMEKTLAALQGLQLAYRPDLWQPYDESRQNVLQVAKPLGELLHRFPSQFMAAKALMDVRSLNVMDAVYIPLIGRKSFWTVIVDSRNGDVLGYLPIDSF